MTRRYIPYSIPPEQYCSDFPFNNRIVLKELARGMELPPVRTIESIGANSNGNLVLHGDCISACAFLKERNIAVDLVYIDPPFASGADYEKKIHIRPTMSHADSGCFFRETEYEDVWGKKEYLSWMYKNLCAIKSVMSGNASIFIHLDRHAGHYVKILLDYLFGEDNFQNEIIWHYRTGGRTEKHFARKHDTIFWYTMNPENYVFHPEAVSEYRGAQKRNNMKKVTGEDGRVYYSIHSAGKEYRYYEDDKIIPDDVWDIPHIQQKAPERTGYATQKPAALLERIIMACSEPGMTVADFFGGSGVTAAVAGLAGRHFIHGDAGFHSIQTVRDRLVSDKQSFDILSLHKTDVPPARDHAEFSLRQTNGVFQITIRKFDSLSVREKINILRGKKDGTGDKIPDDGSNLGWIEFVSADCTAAEGTWHSDSEIRMENNGSTIINGVKSKNLWNGTISTMQTPLRLKIRNICGGETIFPLPRIIVPGQ